MCGLYQTLSQPTTRDVLDLLAPKLLDLLGLLAHLHTTYESILTAVARASLPQRAVAVTHVDVRDVARQLDAGALAEGRECAGFEGDDAALAEAGGAGVEGLGLGGLVEAGELGAAGDEEVGGGRDRSSEGHEGRDGKERSETHCGGFCVVLFAGVVVVEVLV